MRPESRRIREQRRSTAPKLTASRDSSTRARVQQVLRDMRGDAALTLTKAARKRGIDPRTVRSFLPSAFRKDSTGRVRVKASKPRRKTLYIPSTSAGVSIPVGTRNRKERLLLGKWMAALNAAGRNDWSKLRKFPRGKVIGGVRLETSPEKVQPILDALAEEESPFEGLYRTLVRRS